MNKKVISGLMALALVFGAAGVVPANVAGFGTVVTASAENPAEDFNWKIIDDDTIMLTGYKGTEKDVVVPSIVADRTVTQVDNWAFRETDVTSVVLPDTVDTIGWNAFENCKELKTLTLPKEAKSMGDHVCNNCPSLESVNIPEGIEEIAWKSFEGCTSLKEVTIPASVKDIGQNAFYDCTSLSKVTFKEGSLETITQPFQNCTSLKEVVIPEGVTEIQGEAFKNCTSLEKVVLPSTLKRLATVGYSGDGAFANCSSLTSIVLPKNLTLIDDAAFINCTALKDVKIESNVLDKIGENAFKNCPELKEITLPKSITKMDKTGLLSNIDENGEKVLKSDFILHCYKGSKAEVYALNSGLPAANIDYLVDVVKGDVNDDSVVNVTDITLVAAHVKGVKALESDAEKAADVNEDGSVTVTDISNIAAQVKGIKEL